MKTRYWIGLSLFWLVQAGFAQPTTEKQIFFPFFRLAEAPATLLPLAPQNAQIAVQIAGTVATVEVHQLYKNERDTPLALSCIVPVDIDDLQGFAGKMPILRKPTLHQDTEHNGQQALSMPIVAPQSEIELVWRYRIECEQEANASVFRLPAFQPDAENAQVHYDLKIQFQTDLPIRDITSQEHLIEVHYPTPHTAEVIFSKEETKAGTRPFVLRYQFYQTQINAPKPDEGVMRGDVPKEGYEVTHQNIKQDNEVTGEPKHVITKQYIVKENDSIESIATKFGVTVADLQHWNHLKAHTVLKKRQTIKIEIPCVKILHIVAEGEDPYQIAQLYDVSVTEILDWNRLKDTDRLSIGQKIIVYQPKK